MATGRGNEEEPDETREEVFDAVDVALVESMDAEPDANRPRGVRSLSTSSEVVVSTALAPENSLLECVGSSACDPKNEGKSATHMPNEHLDFDAGRNLAASHEIDLEQPEEARTGICEASQKTCCALGLTKALSSNQNSFHFATAVILLDLDQSAHRAVSVRLCILLANLATS